MERIGKTEEAWTIVEEKARIVALTFEKGSITVNGVSLTVVDSMKNSFSVAIIPYTFEYTNFKSIKVGDMVNLEFDVLGKYIQKLYESKI